jgi:hypothetical protein
MTNHMCRMTLAFLSVVGLAVQAWAADGSVTITQITKGPSQHFFGYIGQSRTIPWNASGRYLLALQTSFQDRMPDGNDPADVCLLDARNEYALHVVDQSRGYNPQQGTMFYWNPEHPETQFFFNDRDRKTGKVFTVLFDLTANGGKGGRVREYRFDDSPVGNSGVAQNGGYFLAINYARMARLRPVTGYLGAWDWTEDVAAPADDGIFRIDIATGKRMLIVSFAQLQEALRGVVPRVDERHLFINHTLNNRNNDLIYFFCRADFGKKPAGVQTVNVAFTVRPDGRELTRQEVFIGGHPDWEWGSRIIGSKDKKQVIYDTVTQEIVEVLGGRDVFPNPEGDIALSPDGRWFVNGHGAAGANHYTFLERRTGRVIKSPPISFGKWKGGDLRLDPAPCWNRTGDAVAVPGISEDGTRQMFLIRLDPD